MHLYKNGCKYLIKIRDRKPVEATFRYNGWSEPLFITFNGLKFPPSSNITVLSVIEPDSDSKTEIESETKSEKSIDTAS